MSWSDLTLVKLSGFWLYAIATTNVMHYVADHQEIHDLKDWVLVEQEEKKELQKKLQNAECECKPFHSILCILNRLSCWVIC